jgi:HEAT repeats
MKSLSESSAFAILCWVLALPLSGQTIERDTTITGPRGRTLDRQVEIQRKPGSVSRDIQIKRPGGTFERQVQVQRSPAGVRRGPLIPGPWPRPPWIPRTVVIGQPAPAFGFGLLAAPMLNFSFGGGGGGFGGGGPGVPFRGGGPAGPPGGPAPPPDEVALMAQRLQSFYSNNRKEAAYTLGQLGDPRAVPSLVHVLKYDYHKDVRIASAIALGEIGGSESAIALERSSIYDHKEDVRQASATALERLNAKAKSAPPTSSHVVRPRAVPVPPDPTTPSPFRGRETTGEPAAETPAAISEPTPAQADPGANQPPPPPTPVTGNPGSGNG